jgi:hypothetical protein
MFTDDELRASVRAILEEELDVTKCTFESIDEFWSKRWLWSVNGSHSGLLGRAEPAWAIAFKGQAHRRVAMECWDRNPLEGWDGRTYVSSSLKLEHGKTRLLLACDTRSYTAFTHLLGPVEKAWRNKRTLLDPGSLGKIALAQRVLDLRGSIKLMLDYDDFNSQHTLRAQQIVIEEVCELSGYPPELAAPLVASFERMFLHHEGRRVGVASATLMSGHRGTTFLNSILNSAYIHACAPRLWGKFSSLHTGDDVAASVPSTAVVDELLQRANAVGLRMNPMKQSVGYVCHEFLRMAITDRACYGYVCRAISSCVSGNWTNDNPLSVHEKLMMYITGSRSCINRSGSTAMADVIALSAHHSTRIDYDVCVQLMRGEVSLGHGPVFCSTAQTRNIHIKDPPSMWNQEVELKRATKAYLAHHVSPVERLAMDLAAVSVERQMVEASYSKSLPSDPGAIQPRSIHVSHSNIGVPRGLEWDFDLRYRDRKEGVLMRYPLLVMLKETLSSSALRRVFDFLAIRPSGDLYEAAWGREPNSIAVDGVLPYAEAAEACSRLGHTILKVARPIFM